MANLHPDLHPLYADHLATDEQRDGHHRLDAGGSVTGHAQSGALVVVLHDGSARGERAAGDTLPRADHVVVDTGQGSPGSGLGSEAARRIEQRHAGGSPLHELACPRRDQVEHLLAIGLAGERERDLVNGGAKALDAAGEDALRGSRSQ